MATLTLDHAFLGVQDLDAAADRLLRDHGLASYPGGRHVGLGTGNRVVPLGSQYMEILAVVDEEEARGSDFGRWVIDRLAGGERWLGWVLRTDDVDAVAGRLGLEPVAMSRERPDGAAVRWRLVGFDEWMADPQLPFFIQWDIPPDLHPGRGKAAHRRSVEGIVRVTVAGDEDRIREWTGGADLPVEVVDGDPGVVEVAFRIDGDDVPVRPA